MRARSTLVRVGIPAGMPRIFIHFAAEFTPVSCNATRLLVVFSPIVSWLFYRD